MKQVYLLYYITKDYDFEPYILTGVFDSLESVNCLLNKFYENWKRRYRGKRPKEVWIEQNYKIETCKMNREIL